MNRERFGEDLRHPSPRLDAALVGEPEILHAKVSRLLAETAFPGHIGDIGLEAIDEVKTQHRLPAIGQADDEGIAIRPVRRHISTTFEGLQGLLRPGGSERQREADGHKPSQGKGGFSGRARGNFRHTGS